MGLFLLKLAIVGVFTSNKLEGKSSEDVQASRHTVAKGFVTMMFYMMANLLTFCVYLFACIWFLFFGSAPTQLMEASYYLQRDGSTVSPYLICC